MSRLTTILADSLQGIFPLCCALCDRELVHADEILCSFCLQGLPQSHISNADDNPVLDVFTGRLPLQYGYSWLRYDKLSGIQKLLQEIKYNDKPEAAVAMGKALAQREQNKGWWREIEALIPVPIHPRKQFIRGYNQSEKLAEGISAVWSTPVDTTWLMRQRHSESQTKKGRQTRWEGLQGVFATKSLREYKHVALVDDVITTGATLEKIGRAVRAQNPQLQISVITLAITL